MTMNKAEARRTIESLNAVGSPVERQVRPAVAGDKDSTMQTQKEALDFLRGWFDRLGGVSYVHHDSDTETTVEATLDLGMLAAELFDEVAKGLAAERERCAKLCEANSQRWDAIGGDGGASLECADLIRRA
jgi:hypothetical protein